MKINTTDDVHELLQAFIDSAVLGTALELGLFWRLAEQPQTAPGVAQVLGIPPRRCRYWLDLLQRQGLLTCAEGNYAPSGKARTAILDVYSHEAWAMLAQEWRERFPPVRDLARHINEPGSLWAIQGLEPPDWFALISGSLERAGRFTRMLYEIHLPLADELATTLDMTGVRRLMDLGGGSGVMSLALLRRHPDLAGVVVDIESVCAAGREIAAGQAGAERIRYHAADFERDELPGGFDMVLACDVGVWGQALLRKLRASLNPGGRLVLVDQFAPAAGVAPAGRPYLHWAFLSSLESPDASFRTADEYRAQLPAAGFRVLAEYTLSEGWLVIEAAREPTPDEIRD
jgi:SAM-dependent methyltransferase